METNLGMKKNAPNKTLIAVVVLIAVVIIAAVAILGRQEPEDDGLHIKYASDAKVLLDQDSVQAAMDEAMKNAEDGNIGLYYKNDAYSTDGVHFTCFVGNSSANAFDMFLTIYSDAELTDQLYLSELLPPGSGYEEIDLEKALSPGDHTVYVALTQVGTDEDTGEQTALRQVVHTMDFHVSQ